MLSVEEEKRRSWIISSAGDVTPVLRWLLVTTGRHRCSALLCGLCVIFATFAVKIFNRKVREGLRKDRKKVHSARPIFADKNRTSR
jgi:hypothetical protein